MKRELCVSIDNQRLGGLHGLFPQERITGHEFLVSVHTWLSIDDAVRDEIADTLSYADIHQTVIEEFSKTSKLIEHVAERILSNLCNRFPIIHKADCKIVKLSPPIFGFDGEASIQLFFQK